MNESGLCAQCERSQPNNGRAEWETFGWQTSDGEQEVGKLLLVCQRCGHVLDTRDSDVPESMSITVDDGGREETQSD